MIYAEIKSLLMLDTSTTLMSMCLFCRKAAEEHYERQLDAMRRERSNNGWAILGYILGGVGNALLKPFPDRIYEYEDD